MEDIPDDVLEDEILSKLNIYDLSISSKVDSRFKKLSETHFKRKRTEMLIYNKLLTLTIMCYLTKYKAKSVELMFPQFPYITHSIIENEAGKTRKKSKKEPLDILIEKSFKQKYVYFISWEKSTYDIFPGYKIPNASWETTDYETKIENHVDTGKDFYKNYSRFIPEGGAVEADEKKNFLAIYNEIKEKYETGEIKLPNF